VARKVTTDEHPKRVAPPRHEQEECEYGEESECPEHIAPPRRRGPAAHRPLLIVLVPDAARVGAGAARQPAQPPPRAGAAEVQGRRRRSRPAPPTTPQSPRADATAAPRKPPDNSVLRSSCFAH
jgi:hypothetical protein